MRLTVRKALAASTTLVLVALPAEAQTWTQWRDLGVPVVEHSRTQPLQTWSLSAPQLVLGLIDGPPEHLFTHIWDAERSTDGRIVVVEASSHEVRVFDSEGRHQATFGGKGGGPEEFGGPPWISLDADTVRVWDPGHYRESSFSLDGELLSQVTLRDAVVEAGIAPFPNGLVWETSKAGQLWTGGVRLRPREGLNLGLRRFVWITAEGVAQDLGTFRNGRTYYMALDGGFRGIADPFAPASVAAVSSEGRIAISEGETGDVLVLGPDLEPALLLATSIQRLPVHSEAVAEYRGRLRGISAQLRVPLRRLEAAHAAIPVPDSLPTIADLAWSSGGDLWVGRRSGEIWSIDEYHVFAPDGSWRARLELPSEVDAILAVGANYVLARHRDALDVQYLQLHSIVR